MTSTQMYELARNAVIEYEHIQPEDENQPDVLWVGGVLENRRAVVWCGIKLYMVQHNTFTKQTTVTVYTAEGGEAESNG